MERDLKGRENKKSENSDNNIQNNPAEKEKLPGILIKLCILHKNNILYINVLNELYKYDSITIRK